MGECAQRVPELWGFKYGGAFGPKLTSSITILSMVGLGFRTPWGVRKSSMFSFSLSIMLLNSRVCANDFAIKVFEYGNAFDTVGKGRFVVMQPHST